MEIVRDDTRSILFSSHNTQDVERICDQIAFIDRGRLVDARDKENFLERWRDGATVTIGAQPAQVAVHIALSPDSPPP